MFFESTLMYTQSMNFLQWINSVVVLVGLPTITAALIFIGKKLQILEFLEVSTDKIKHNMKVVSDYLIRNHTKFDPKELQDSNKYLSEHPEITQ
jgi:hypothetical protein